MNPLAHIRRRDPLASPDVGDLHTSTANSPRLGTTGPVLRLGEHEGAMHDISKPSLEPSPRRGPRLRYAGLMAAGILAFGATVAACGGSPSTLSSATGSKAPTKGLVAYASCMRSHGVPKFPDPASTGGIPKETPPQLGVSTSQFAVAQNACKHLLPSGGSLSGKPSQQLTAKQRRDYLKAAICMRSHGITDFPDPVFTGGTVEFPKLEDLVDLNSPLVKHAYEICQKLIPLGLPYSGSGG